MSLITSISKNDLIKLISDSDSISQVLTHLGYKNSKKDTTSEREQNFNVAGYKYYVIWEHEITNNTFENKLKKFIED